MWLTKSGKGVRMAQRVKKDKAEPKTPDILISWNEFNRRKKIWEEYYKKVPETRAYKRFIEQKEALKKGNLDVVKRLAQEAKQQIIYGTSELSKPSFPDPEVEMVYGRLGIKKEDIVSKAQEIFSEGVNDNE